VRIDLGGIGKGLAADRVARGLIERGATAASVALGGDLALAGTPPGGWWDVPVEDPMRDGRVLFHHHLAGGAIVTSTTRIRRWDSYECTYHHIFDPRAGRPTDSGVVAAIVAGSDAWWAEGIAKAAIAAGPDLGRELLEQSGLVSWLFDEEGRVIEARLETAIREETRCSPK
jgi:thiamine biosynthesis lipoprotein